MEWLIAYGVGAALFLVLAGAASSREEIEWEAFSLILWTLIWPIPFLFCVGHALWGKR